MSGSDREIRRQLPGRRPLFAEPLTWAGAGWLLGVGFDEDGKVREIWLDPADTEIAVEAAIVIEIHHTCIIASWLLQCGKSVAECAARITGTQPSLLGLALARGAEMEIEMGSRVRLLNQWSARQRAGETITPRMATEEELALQRQSWVRGEMAIGLDQQEAADRAAWREREKSR